MSANDDINLIKLQHERLIRIKDIAEDVRNWLHEAPRAELEAVEKALSRKAPIHEIHELHNLLSMAMAHAYERLLEVTTEAQHEAS